MKRYQCLGSISFGLAALALLLLASPAQAHTLLLEPNGGEQLEVGSEFTVTWQVTGGNYNPLNWDLWYSTTSAGGPWLELAYDLPAGSGANGSIHTYDWTVPNVVDDSVWVRVRMDNSGVDYYDESDFPFSIILAPESGDVGQQMYVIKQEDSVSLTWDASCSGNDTDYAVYEGKLGNFTSHRPVVCSTGGNTESSPFIPEPGDRYFLVVPRHATHEGSYGTDSEEEQRPPSGLACLPQGTLSCP